MKLKGNFLLLLNWVTFIAFMAVLSTIALYREYRANKLFAAQYIDDAVRHASHAFVYELRELDRHFTTASDRLQRLHAHGESYLASNGPAATVHALQAVLAAELPPGDAVDISLVSSNLVIAHTTHAPEEGLDLSQFADAVAQCRAARTKGGIVIIHPMLESTGKSMRAYSMSWLPSCGMYLQLHYRNAIVDATWQELKSVALDNPSLTNLSVYTVMRDTRSGAVTVGDLCATTEPVTAQQHSNIVAALAQPDAFVIVERPGNPHLRDFYRVAQALPPGLFNIPDIETRIVHRIGMDIGVQQHATQRSWLVMCSLLLVFAVLSMLEYMFIVRQYVRPLHGSRQMLQGVLDTIPVRVFWKDRSLRYLGCNRVFATDAGLASPEFIIGMTDNEMSWAQYAERYRADDRAVMASATPWLAVEEPYVIAGGRPRWLRTSKIPLRDERDHIIGVLCMSEDITEWKRNQDALQRHAQFEQTIARISTRLMDMSDLAAAIEASLADIGTTLATERATLVRVNISTRIIETVYQWCQNTASDSRVSLHGLRIADGAWAAERVMSLTGLVVNDIEHMPDEAAQERATYVRMGIRAIMGAPLRKFGRETGFITTPMLTSARVWRDDEFLFLSSCAQILSGALERHDILRELQQQRDTLEEQVAARTAALQSTNQWLQREIDERLSAEDALRQSEALYLSSVNSLRDWVHVIDQDFRILFANTALEHAASDFQFAPGLVGKILFDAMPFLGDHIRTEYQQVFATGTSAITQEMTIVNGRQVFTETKKTPVVVAGCVVRVVTYIADITEKKLSEQAIRDSEAQYRALFTGSPIALIDFDAREAFVLIARLRQEGVRDLAAHFAQHPGLVRECAAYHIVRAANNRMLELFGAHSIEDLQQRRPEVYREETIAMIAAYLVAIASGATSFQAETVLNTFSGDIRYCMASFTVMPGYEPPSTRIILALVDITERKQIEEALRLSEAKFVSAFRSNPSLIAIIKSADGSITDCNDVYASAFGRSREELIGTTDIAINVWVDERQRAEALDILSRNGRLRDFEMQFRTRRGDIRDGLMSAEPLLINGELHLITSAIDITERTQTRLAIAASEARYRTLFESNSIAMMEVDWSALRDDILALRNVTDDIENYLALHPDLTEAIYAKRRVCAMNTNMRNLFGTASIQETTDKMAAASSPNNFTPFNHHVAAVARGERECETERIMHMPDGRDLVLLIRICVPPGAEQTWDRIIVSVLDMTERRKTELQLRNYEVQLRAMASELTLAEERERRRIADGLHDDVSQTLALVKMQLTMLPVARAGKILLDSLRDALDSAISSVRSLTFDLSPPALHELGLPAALDWLAEKTHHQHGLTCIFTSRTEIPALNETMRTMLFLIARELLVNVAKHAEATRASVSLALHDHMLSMEIADNGKGLPEAAGTNTAMQHGFGLFGIRERLKFLGGSFDIRSMPGKGTTALINVPLAHGLPTASPVNAENLHHSGMQ